MHRSLMLVVLALALLGCSSSPPSEPASAPVQMAQIPSGPPGEDEMRVAELLARGMAQGKER